MALILERPQVLNIHTIIPLENDFKIIILYVAQTVYTKGKETESATPFYYKKRLHSLSRLT